jgi:hypothetical protein
MPLVDPGVDHKPFKWGNSKISRRSLSGGKNYLNPVHLKGVYSIENKQFISFLA